jgi:hypothetical protein
MSPKFIGDDVHQLAYLTYLLRIGFVWLLAAGAVAGIAPDAFAAISHDPQLTWKTLHTRHFRIHFHDGEEQLARDTADIAESVHLRLVPLLAWQPSRPTDIVVTDEIDMANGFTTTLPSNRVELWVTPPDDGLFDYGPWLESLILHEYAHVLHLDMAAGTPASWRRIFGRHPLLFPQSLQPQWVIEGLATRIETDVAHGLGRGQSSYFAMLMRMEAVAGIKPLRQVNQPVNTWPSGIVPYLYGENFLHFIEEKYGQEQLLEWIVEYRDNLIPFMINTNSKKVFGQDLSELWQHFTEYVEQRYQAQLQQIEAQGIREGEILAQHGYTTGDSAVLPDGTVFYVRSDGKSPPMLMRWRATDSEPQPLVELQGDARLAVHPRMGVLVAQPERERNVLIRYDLYRYDLTTGQLRRLTEGARLRFAAWSPDGEQIAAVRTELGEFSLVRLNAEGKDLETLWRATNGEIVSGIDWSPRQGALLASLWQAHSGWNVAEFSLEDRRWHLLTDDNAIKMHARYTPDGEAVLFSGDYGSVYNIRRLDKRNGQITTLTNVRGGAFSPGLASDGTLIYTGYTSRGYDVFRLATPASLGAPALSNGPTASPMPPAARLSDTWVSDYQPTTGLAPTWWTPIVGVGSDFTLLGASTSGADVLRRHVYGLAGGYEFSNDEPVGSFDYIYDRWYPRIELHASRALSLEHESDSELRRVQQSTFVSAGITLPWLKMREQWALHAGLATEKKHDSYTAVGYEPRPDRNDNLYGIALRFDSARRYPLSVSSSYGRSVIAMVENSDLGASDYTGQVYTFDWREFASLGGEHVLALRLVTGWGTEDPRRFQLGGALSSASLLQTEGLGSTLPFNRRDYPLRGYADGLSGLAGRRMQLAEAEWRFPLARVERGYMAPPLALDQLYGALFVDGGAAWYEGSHPDRYYTGVGGELTADVRFFYGFTLPVTLGFARGLAAIGENQIYLRAGATF